MSTELQNKYKLYKQPTLEHNIRIPNVNIIISRNLYFMIMIF